MLNQTGPDVCTGSAIFDRPLGNKKAWKRGRLQAFRSCFARVRKLCCIPGTGGPVDPSCN